QNAGFLRPNAELAIIILTQEDDCSAPAFTYLYSLNNGAGNSIKNSLGPLTQYRCNEFGHLCLVPNGDPTNWIPPPATPGTIAQGSPPTLNLVDCQSNESDGLLTPVATLTAGIKALKANPDAQIFVEAIAAPATPYTVAWSPAIAGELWP